MTKEKSYRITKNDFQVRDIQELTKEEIKSISKKSEGWSGGKLASLCEEAKLSAIREKDYKSVVVVEGKHLENALKKLSG